MKHRSDLYSALFAAAPDAIVVMNEDSMILDANPAVHALFGYSSPELIGEDLTKIMPPALAVRHKAGFARYLRSGVRNIPWSGIRLETQRKDGSLVDVDISFTEVQEGGGRLFAGIIRNVTARTWAERRLTAQFQVADLLGKAVDLSSAGPGLLEAIAESLGWKWGGLWIVEGSEMKAIAEWPAGVAEHAMIGRTFRRAEGLPGRAWESSKPVWIANVEQDDNFPRASLASRLGLRSGMAFPILAQNHVLGVLEFFSAMTRPPDEDILQLVHAIGQQIGQFIARRDAQAALEKSNAELQQFASTVSHDLQEPIRAISISTQILLQKEESYSADARNMLENIGTAAKSMQALTTDLLAFAEAKSGEIVREEVSLDDVLQRVLDLLSVQISNTGATITHGPLPRFITSASDLGQIFQNLLSNGLKYSKPGQSPQIHITAGIDNSTLKCSVADNGQGIPTQYRERIFEPFKRLHTREVSGSGLGLAICRRLVERHGGAIWVAEGQDEGATFKFTLRN